MSNKVSHRDRLSKAIHRALDYVARKPLLWAMTARADIEDGKPESTRLTVAERIRFKYWLYWKYGPECAYCHKFYDWRHALTIDHIQPRSKGGAIRDIRNMVLACRACNEAKGDNWIY